jgi:hypothetical protein
VRCIEERLIVEGLVQKSNGALRECSFLHFVISMSGCEDDRNRAPHAMELALKVRAAQSGHPHIEDQTFHIVHVMRGEERFR